jgi:hypothetical protein
MIDSSKCAMATAPLHSPAGVAGECMHVWVFPYINGVASSALDGIEIAGSKWTVFAVHAETGTISGQSWQLAFALAARAIEERAQAYSLAFEWIISGCVPDYTKSLNPVLKRVILGTKLSLYGRPGKRYIFPAENNDDIAATRGYAGANFSVYTASDINHAWNIVCRKGTIHEGVDDPPSRPVELHSFVSGAWRPVVAAILLLKPARVVLWHSDQAEISSGRAIEIEKAIPELARVAGFDPPVVERKDIDSRSPHIAEQQLLPVLKERIENNDGLVRFFNVTQGNRLMFFAAHTMAIMFGEQLTLIYRDLDSTPFDFTTIRYKALSNPVTKSLTLHPHESIDTINWSAVFYTQSDKESITSDYMIREIKVQK